MRSIIALLSVIARCPFVDDATRDRARELMFGLDPGGATRAAWRL